MSQNTDFGSVLESLGLPSNARLNMRVPKRLLVEQGAPTAFDKRIIVDGIEELQWFAACKPATIGVPTFKDDTREYLEIAAIGCVFRPEAKTTRLIELIHRAIPYPVLLINTESDGMALSLAHKRLAEREAGRVVIDRVVTTGPIGSSAVDHAFLASLALVRQPRHNMHTLYDGWLTRVEALQAARVSGVYLASDDQDVVRRRRDALETHTQLLREIASLRVRAEREKKMKGRVDLNMQIKCLEAALADLNRDL